MIGQAAATLRRILREPYDSYVREHTPRRWGTYNGVELRKRRLLDRTGFARAPIRWRLSAVRPREDCFR